MTVEIALVLPVVVLLILFGVSVQSVASTQLAVQEQTRQAARLASLGTSQQDIAQKLSIPSDRLTVTVEPPFVRVSMSSPHRVLGFIDIRLKIDAQATALHEQYLGGAE